MQLSGIIHSEEIKNSLQKPNPFYSLINSFFMKQKLTICLLLIMGCVHLQAQMNKIDFVEYDLDNGMHVILHQDNSTPIVAVSVMYHVGSKNEKPDRTGFAHFFEHLLFEGSENIERGQFDKHINGSGGANLSLIHI